MVRMEKDTFVIELESTCPADRWVDVMRDLIRCVSVTDEQDARKMMKG